jgi:UDP-N-acetylglucosamine acyltransferase
MIHPTAVIYPNVIIGENVTIGAFTVIGSPAESKGHDPVNPIGTVVIGDGTIIREHVTIHAPSRVDGVTRIGKNCYIQAHSHIGHDSILGDNVTLACYACVGGHNKVGDYANFGLHAVSHQFSTIGQGTMIGACAFVKGVVEDWSVYVGVPAKRIKANQYLIDKLSEGKEL